MSDHAIAHAVSRRRRFRLCPRLAACAVSVPLVAGGMAAALAAPRPDLGLHDDPVVARLVGESLAARMDIRQAEALTAAERERVPQAGALPDPVLGFGIQNDSFKRIEIGRAETSFYQVMVSQGLPFPGKRALRTEVAGLAAEQVQTSVARVRLSTEAEVRRAYLDLLLARERLQLLQGLEAIWQQAAGIASTRYETGEGAQADVLRSQLELGRIAQRRALLQAEEQMRVQALNRLRGRPLGEPIASGASIRDVLPGGPLDVDALVDDAVARSPELAQARLGVARAGKQVALAERDRYPDFGVNLGVMPRGSLEPMWTVGVSVGLPVWLGRKQGRAVVEETRRAEAESASAASVEHLLRLRVAERSSALTALRETIRVYRAGLLVRSRATVDSTVSQYGVGRLPFVAVLDANAGYLDDEDGYVVALAAAQRIAIAAQEVSLDPIAWTVGGEGMRGSAAAGGAAAGGGMAASDSAQPLQRERGAGAAPGM